MKPLIKNKTSNKIPNGVKAIILCINQTKEPDINSSLRFLSFWQEVLMS